MNTAQPSSVAAFSPGISTDAYCLLLQKRALARPPLGLFSAPAADDRARRHHFEAAQRIAARILSGARVPA
jgi:hypothetical protein